MKQLNNTAYNFSVLLILILFFIILNFLNKKESKVICMREFEIILLQTQSLSIKPFNYYAPTVSLFSPWGGGGGAGYPGDSWTLTTL
jgi:hypothetical protein